MHSIGCTRCFIVVIGVLSSSLEWLAIVVAGASIIVAGICPGVGGVDMDMHGGCDGIDVHSGCDGVDMQVNLLGRYCQHMMDVGVY